MIFGIVALCVVSGVVIYDKLVAPAFRLNTLVF